MHNRINKWVDLLDRTAWTFLMTLFSSFIIWGFDSWKPVLAAAALAAFGTGGKTTVAQNVGDSGLGDAVPGKSVVKSQ